MIMFPSNKCKVACALHNLSRSPPMPLPGWARKSIQKRQHVKFTDEQRAFLDDAFFILFHAVRGAGAFAFRTAPLSAALGALSRLLADHRVCPSLR